MIFEKSQGSASHALRLSALIRSLKDRLHNDHDFYFGPAGRIMFFYGLASLEDDETDDSRYAEELLVESYKYLRKVRAIPRFSSVPATGWVFCWLTNNGFIDIDLDTMLEDVDLLISNDVQKNFSIDLINGGILSKGSYLIERFSLTKDVINRDKIEESLAYVVDEVEYQFQQMVNSKTRTLANSNDHAVDKRIDAVVSSSRMYAFLNKCMDIDIYSSKVNSLAQTIAGHIIDQTYLIPSLSSSATEKAGRLESLLLTLTAIAQSRVPFKEQELFLKFYSERVAGGLGFDMQNPQISVFSAIKSLKFSRVLAEKSGSELTRLEEKLFDYLIQSSFTDPATIVGIPSAGLAGISGIGLSALESEGNLSLGWEDALMFY